MDMIEFLSPSELRARIFISKSKIYELKAERKKLHFYIKKAKILIKNIERALDRKLETELISFEISSVSNYLEYLRGSLIELDSIWKVEREHCANLHEKLDSLNERVYVC
jgi:hypothetical protein